jgi:hypothetical protein
MWSFDVAAMQDFRSFAPAASRSDAATLQVQGAIAEAIDGGIQCGAGSSDPARIREDQYD